jgi:integrase
LIRRLSGSALPCCMPCAMVYLTLRTWGDAVLKSICSKRHAKHPPADRPRVARATPASAGKPEVAFFVFVSESGAPLSAPGFSRMIERAAKAANLGIKAHAHMLRHGCGYKLANDGIDTRALQAYLGHRNIQNTTRYTALAPDRFKGFWRD